MNKIDFTPNLADLPPRQRDVLGFIISLTEEHGYPPTLAELATAMGLKNRMTIHQHVQALKKKGFVHWEPGLNRSLRVQSQYQLHSQEHSRELSGKHTKNTKTHKNNDQSASDLSVKTDRGRAFSGNVSINTQKGIPLIGRIAAGAPLDAIGSEEYLEIESQYAGEAGCYALKVKGDSMIEEGIFDGDYVIIKANPSPRNGEVVVALLQDGSATLKRFFKENGSYRLEPANKNYAPIRVPGEQGLEIQGVVVALFRKM
jgi:repressor LexA